MTREIYFELDSESLELAEYIRKHKRDSAEHRNRIDRNANQVKIEHARLIEAERVLNRG